jgi:hypothetical protein
MFGFDDRDVPPQLLEYTHKSSIDRRIPSNIVHFR